MNFVNQISLPGMLCFPKKKPSKTDVDCIEDCFALRLTQLHILVRLQPFVKDEGRSGANRLWSIAGVLRLALSEHEIECKLSK